MVVYSPVRAVAVAQTSVLARYPNPAHSAVTLNGTLLNTRVQVLDVLSCQVTAATTDAAGKTTLLLPQGHIRGAGRPRSGLLISGIANAKRPGRTLPEGS